MITLILLATEATDSPFFWAVKAMTLNMAINKNPRMIIPINQLDDKISDAISGLSLWIRPQIQAVM
ncbi:hypothetical protein GCM10011444_27270 [Winogradskyella haliclonae]|uniref:Uncharacterized protein n=1 Tax=Winogradskyella haliclonae TaxID=2048558 RepID=A0ABQ2C5P7_9FLAO|nr:hypothetical protein GCM10011444_27270 [Winogradskyella haliclonae]